MLLWGLENSLSSCPGAVGEPQLLFLARETKMEATDTDSQYDTGGALRASPGGGVGEDPEKSPGGLSLVQGHRALWSLFRPPPTPGLLGSFLSIWDCPLRSPRSRDSPAQAVLSAMDLQPHWQGAQSQKHILRSFSSASPWLLIQYRAHNKSRAMNISGSKEKTFPCFQV